MKRNQFLIGALLCASTTFAQWTGTTTPTTTTTSNVGIGTVTPFYKLDIRKSETNDVLVGINNENTATTARAGLIIGTLPNYDIGTYLTQSTAGNLFSIDNNGDPNSRISFSTRPATGNSVERLRIDENGKVGIGISNPTVALDVLGSGKFSEGVSINRASNDAFVSLSRNSVEVGQLRGYSTTGLGFYSPNLGRHTLFAGASSGKIGIGTITPAELLHVRNANQSSDPEQNNSVLILESFNNQSVRFSKSGVGNWSVGRNAQNKFTIYSGSNIELDGANERLTIAPANGFVLIGRNNTSAQEKLHMHEGSIRMEAGYSLNWMNPTSGSSDVKSYIQMSASDNLLVSSTNRTVFYNGAGAQSMVIDGLGNVGINNGSLNPSAKLHVNGSIKLEGIGGAAGKVLTSDANGNATWQVLPAGANLWQAVGSAINYMNGKVGIGTTTPNELVQFGDRFTFHNGGTKVLGFNSKYDGALSADARIVSGAGVSQLRFSNDGAFEITNAPIGNTGAIAFAGLIYMSPNGNVGIGTRLGQNAYGHKLSVLGSIRAKEIVVETGWADYVFADGYQLKPLSEVEAYIEKNNTLPNVPSEQKIKEDNIGLGELTKIQQEKIEELTLYIIEMNKKLETQQKQIDSIIGK